MFIRHIFVAKPLIALAILVCMGTIIALFRLNRQKPQSKNDQFLIGFLGLLTIYEALKILKDSGVVTLAVNSMFEDALELLVAAACLVAAILLRVSRVNHLDVESAVRLARAAPPRLARAEGAVPPKESSTLETLGWAAPRLSDGAFKLLAVLCLRSEVATGRVPVGVVDVQLKLGKTRDELDHNLKELQEAGAVVLRRRGTVMDIEIVQTQRQAPVAPESIAPRPSSLVTEARL
ncbi:MAG: hypothetical protein LAO79_09705 [Acidobacteriia bacterium]|nr:hypothetical protein [Terriglobia bacterium]